MAHIDLSGAWRCEIPGQAGQMRLPGTLDEAGIGHADTGANQWHPDAASNKALMETDVIATRLTRKHTFEGAATLTRRVRTDIPAGRRVFLEAERARCLSLQVNGRPAPDFEPPTLVTPHVFEVTGLLTGDDELTLVSDNSYPGLPHDDIVYSSAATDETQTNWNGALGYVRLRVENPAFIRRVCAYPHGDRLDVCVEIASDRAWKGCVRVASEALRTPAEACAEMESGNRAVWLRDLELSADALRWDVGEGSLYALTASGDGLEPATVRFGVRDFRAADGHFALNGRRVFLRSEANCAVFPETGYPPMDAEAWMEILETYRAYGVNMMRFHSHVPPEAAFEAADRLGMLMQPELCHWNPRDAFEREESYAYYRSELEQTLLWLANHPSFVMLSFGNELHAGELGHRRMDALLDRARALDPTRLYANASNAHYGILGCDPNSDFYTAANWHDGMLRATSAGMVGPLNREYANAAFNYDGTMARLRAQYGGPVMSFEVGQYEVLPDFDEIEGFRGVTRADNLALIRDKARRKGFAADWKRRVEATGELSLLCYRAEVEAALRTEGLSGISLLGLQDFPGQGTALVGMLNSHLRPKPYDFARPERFQAFFRDVLPLPLLERYTYEAGEATVVAVNLANYGKKEICGRLRWRLGVASGELPEAVAPAGGLTRLGEIALRLPEEASARKYDLELDFAGHRNACPVWVYPGGEPICPPRIHEAREFDARAEAVLEAGGAVYLSPDSDAEHLPRSIQAQFSTDFWSVGTFPFQEGGMGQLIDAAHPLFRRFPTDKHTDWQWWPMANRRAMLVPAELRPIVAELDSYATMRPMAQLFEGRCGNGRILVSSMGLHEIQRYPEARALLRAIYDYMDSDEFAPSQRLSAEWLRELTGETRGE